jgi:hypothetical protein
VQISVLPDRAGHLLVQLAETAALLVLGRASGRPRRNATVHAALHRTAVPVLTVPVHAPVLPEADAAPPGVPAPAEPLEQPATHPVG